MISEGSTLDGICGAIVKESVVLFLLILTRWFAFVFPNFCFSFLFCSHFASVHYFQASPHYSRRSAQTAAPPTEGLGELGRETREGRNTDLKF